MNGIDNAIVFYPAAIVMLLFGVLTIYFKNIFYSLLSAITVFFLAGMFFYVLGSEYNAVIQIAIYGVAIPIILALGIMFTDHNSKEEDTKSSLRYVMLLIGGIFILAMVYLIMTSLVVVPDGFVVNEINNVSAKGVINAFANGIFIRYVWAFELVSLILTIIVAGLTIFKKVNRGGEHNE